jgi:hypothetical protein
MTSPALPFRDLQVSLRSITETFAGELASPTPEAPRWSGPEWRLARAVAAIHGISSLLSSTLRWRDAPGNWIEFLAEQRTHTTLRFGRIRELLSKIDARARENGLAAVALKGAELHALDLYEPGDRPMADVDLLVSESQRDAGARLIESLGLRPKLSMERHLVFASSEHAPPPVLGEHSDNDIKIELHTRIREQLPVDPSDITATIFPRGPSAGLNPYPSLAALMAHLLLHAAGAMVPQALRLLHLTDIHRLAARMTDRDWDQFLEAARTDTGLWWAFPPLQLAARYFSCVPQRVLLTIEESCPHSLARAAKSWELSDVSLSYLWIDAFPGMKWATTVGARARYALRRIHPPREILETRTVLLQSEPRNLGSEWARMPQVRRILKWLITRHMRVDTLSAVRAALAQSS